MYRLDNAPYLSEQTIFTMFDIDWKKRADFVFNHNHVDDFCELCEDTSEDEEYLQRYATEINYRGTVAVAMLSDSSKLLLNRKYMKPLDDLEEVRYFRRVDPLGREYVVAKDGMLVVAVIYPIQLGKGQNILAKELKSLAHFVYEQWEKAERESEA